MTVPRGQPPEILQRDSVPYRKHAEHIDGLLQDAKRIGWMRREIRDEVITAAGIVCDRPEGDDRASASRMYFGRAKNVLDQESRIGDGEVSEQLMAQRELVEYMLAIRFSIGDMTLPGAAPEKSDDTVDIYQHLIREFEEHCRTHSIPSLLPNLYLPSSLYAQLRKNPAYSRKDPAVLEMYNKLVVLCCNQTKHLHGVTTAMAFHDMDAESVTSLDLAADIRGSSLIEMSRQNPPLAETLAVALFKSGQHERVVEIGDVFFQHTDRPFLVEKYLRSLMLLGRTDRILEIFTQHASAIPRSHSGTEKAAVDVCIEAGWILYGEGRYADILAMIENALFYHISPKGNADIVALYRQAVGELGDDEKIAAFKRRMNEA